MVFWIIAAQTLAGREANGLGMSGSTGKLSRAIPTSLKDDLSQVTCTQWFSRSLKRTSASGKERIISNRRFAGIVPDPPSFTLAGQLQRIPRSRSVALIRRVDSSTSKSRFERIGIVVFRSTTPCERVSSLRRSALLVEISIEFFSQRIGFSSSACVFVENWRTLGIEST